MAAANEVSGVSLIDIRVKRAVLRYQSHGDSEFEADGGSRFGFGSGTNQNVMSVRFSRCGKKLAVLRSKLRPAIYQVLSKKFKMKLLDLIMIKKYPYSHGAIEMFFFRNTRQNN